MFTFAKATPNEIKRSLARVVKGEKLQIDEKTLDAIARKADGSFRDATKLLEQLVSESEKKDISISSTSENNFIEGSEMDAKTFIRMLIGKKTKEAISFLELQEKSGYDFQEFTKNILMVLHEHLMTRYGQETETMKELKTLSIPDLKYLIKLLTSSYQEMKGSVVAQLPLELAVIEWCDRK
jgi:DNA polymerase-3 subunit gamma/tau